MNEERSTRPAIAETNAIDTTLSRSAYNISVMLLIATVPSVGLFVYYGLLIPAWQLLIVSAIMSVSSFGAVAALFLIPRGRSNLAMMIVITNFTITFIAIPFFIQSLGIVLAITLFIVTVAITGLAMPTRFAVPGLIFAFISGLLIFILDSTLLGVDRLRVLQIERSVPVIVIGFTLFFVVFTFRQFNRFSLRIKIVLGIIITGGITVVVLLSFGLSRAEVIVNTLANKYEENITAQTKAKIIETVQVEANKTDDVFKEALNDLNSVVEYRAKLEAQRNSISKGNYWNSNEKLFQLSDGQYTNSKDEPASIFIPNIYTPDNAVFFDLNTTAYLDFYVPSFLENHPEVVAVYFMSKYGSTTYYPNIGLAQFVPADFDTLAQPFYTIADPQNNPEKLPRWTELYQDPAGTGLIVTLSMPVYTRENVFIGVIGADMQVSKIAETISAIQIGKTGFAFLVDNHGHIITMPTRGYEFFDLQPEEIPLNESPTQGILGIGQDSLQKISQQIVDGGTGLLIENIQDVETYISFAPLNTTEYRFAVIAPAVELNEPIITSRQETQNEIQTSVGGGFLILVIAFIGAFIFSLWVGQIITSPLLRLTTIMEQVTAGDLSVRANIETQDETGLLAKSFNLMTNQLNDTLSNLENRVQERTQDLEKANESLVRRAVQFESISRIARAISTTQILNDLLPQITIAISEQFNFYHAGIFLLDANREYAILVAANSEGGRRMLNRNHRLRVGGSGIVGFVTNTGQPRIALDVGQDAAYFNNPDLPETHSEMALPLRVGNEVIGALDVQSTKTNAFTQEDVDILSTLADQVSIAIQNARLYQQSQESLAMAEAASTRMSGQQWNEFLATQTIEGFTFDGIDAKSIESSNKEPSQGLAIPLTLRGTRIGTLKLSAPDSARTWTDDELAMAQATAERTTLAIESARLLQEAQKRAAKERTIGDISTKIGSLVDIENILQTAIRELGNTLPNTDIAIQFTNENPVAK